MANEQIPPELMAQMMGETEAGLAPAEAAGAVPVEGAVPAEGTPELPPEIPAEAPLQEGIIEAESDALEMDEGDADDAAIRMITSAKEHLYGEGFDQYMEVLQGSENIVEDIAMITVDLIVPELNAVDSLGIGVPVSKIMDISGECTSEVYDCAVQTGVYTPTNEEELTRNQNISVTMVAGELGKLLGQGETIDPNTVESFIDDVMGGGYDDASGMEEEIPMEEGAELPPELPPEIAMTGQPGAIPGAIPGAVPGAMPAMPGAMPGAIPGEVPTEEMPV